jgi:hypothetical protein
MDKSLVLNSIKDYLKIRYDKEFADFLGVKTTTLAMWYKRNTYDIELIFNKCEFLNPEWLLTGKGSMLREELKPIGTEVVPDPKDQVIIELQKNTIDLLQEKNERLEEEIRLQRQRIAQLEYMNEFAYSNSKFTENPARSVLSESKELK